MTDQVRAIADAVLYEGYILWPYRRSAIKNAQRWTFGGVYPRDWSSAGHPDDRWQMQAQVLLAGSPVVDVSVRFLHVLRRQLISDGEPVDELVIDGERHISWEEATERELPPGPISIAGGREEEPLGERASIVRSWLALSGSIELEVERLRDDLHRATLRISNTTPFSGSREEALEQTLCSCHAVLRAGAGAEFVSLTDPPEELREEASACSNVGVWPVLVGEPHERGTMLASPIILEDHPRVAPESPGDLFDGGEIDQMLVLNILALTDEEKDEMRASDPKAREILERTEALSEEDLMRLNGRLSDLRMAKSDRTTRPAGIAAGRSGLDGGHGG
jgi:hypothetical protein